MNKAQKAMAVIVTILAVLLLIDGLAAVGLSIYFHMTTLSMFIPFERMAESQENANAFMTGAISGGVCLLLCFIFAIITWAACGKQKVKGTFIIGLELLLAGVIGGVLVAYETMGMLMPALIDYGYEANAMFHTAFLSAGSSLIGSALLVFIFMMVRASLAKKARKALAKEEADEKTREMIREEVKSEMDKKTGPDGTPVIVNITTGDPKKEEAKEEPKEEAKPEPAPVKEEPKPEPEPVKEEPKEEAKPEPEPAKEEPKPEATPVIVNINMVDPKKEEEKPAEEKPAPKKAPAKKAAPKKEEAKPAPKKEAPKKAEPKKEEPKKAAPKKAESKKEDDEPKDKIYHISQHPTANKWQVKLQGSDKAIKLFDTQAEAIEYAKALAKSQNGSVRLHSRKGSFRSI